MQVIIPRSVHDKDEIAKLLGADPALHAYELGDLDEFFWPYTTWYRHEDCVALVYHGAGFATLLAFDRDPDRLKPLLGGLKALMPARFYLHVSAGAEDVLDAAAEGVPHLKMALTEPRLLDAAEPAGEVLGLDHLDEVTSLYRRAYPGNWFDPRMLETGQYVGLRRGGELVAVAGVHVWSPVFRVAALGNVTTEPRLRGRGLGRAVVAALCHRLRETVDVIALNVKADNASAIALYRGLGFTTVGEYYEAWAAGGSGPAR